MSRRVVVTGMGAITPLGLDVPTLWKNVKAGKSGISELVINRADFPVQNIPRFAGQIDREEFDRLAANTNYFGIRRALYPKVDIAVKLGVAAAREAVLDAKLSPEDLRNAGVVSGYIFGGVETIYRGARALFKENSPVPPSFIPATTSSALPAQVSIVFKTERGALSVNQACATGSGAVLVAWHLIRGGLWNLAIVPCADYYLTPLYASAFGSMAQACSKRPCKPEEASRPYDINRDGFVMSSAGGAIILETEDHARARGITEFRYGELAGCGISSDAKDMIRPDALGQARCMAEALTFAGMQPWDIDYLNAHGTGTKPGDPEELRGIMRTFGSRSTKLPVSSSKSQLGHMMGAAGMVEFIITVLAVRDGIIPPTINLESLDPECQHELIEIVRETREAELVAAMSNSCGFGGLNCSLIVRKF